MSKAGPTKNSQSSATAPEVAVMAPIWSLIVLMSIFSFGFASSRNYLRIYAWLLEPHVKTNEYANESINTINTLQGVIPIGLV